MVCSSAVPLSVLPARLSDYFWDTPSKREVRKKTCRKNWTELKGQTVSVIQMQRSGKEGLCLAQISCPPSDPHKTQAIRPHWYDTKEAGHCLFRQPETQNSCLTHSMSWWQESHLVLRCIGLSASFFKAFLISVAEARPFSCACPWNSSPNLAEC